MKALLQNGNIILAPQGWYPGDFSLAVNTAIGASVSFPAVEPSAPLDTGLGLIVATVTTVTPPTYDPTTQGLTQTYAVSGDTLTQVWTVTALTADQIAAMAAAPGAP